MNADTAITLIDPVDDYAAMSLHPWREAGHIEVEILAMVSDSTAADATWEKAQRARVGHVYPPPADVNASIRQLLTD
jgi:hypothetical protein